jgi:hypothetical protein
MVKYNDTNGIAATVGHLYVSHCHMATLQPAPIIFHRADEMLKSSAYLRETLLNPETASSYDPKAAALSTAFKEDKDYFQWLETPGREYALYRFGMAMRGMNLGGKDAILRG